MFFQYRPTLLTGYVRRILTFKKMALLCELETRHEVDIGSGYKNDQAWAVFVSYIAREQRDQL